MKKKNSKIKMKPALQQGAVGSSAYLKNFGEDIQAFEITDEIKKWAKEQYEKSDKTEFLKIINGR